MNGKATAENKCTPIKGFDLDKVANISGYEENMIRKHEVYENAIDQINIGLKPYERLSKEGVEVGVTINSAGGKGSSAGKSLLNRLANGSLELNGEYISELKGKGIDPTTITTAAQDYIEASNKVTAQRSNLAMAKGEICNAEQMYSSAKKGLYKADGSPTGDKYVALGKTPDGNFMYAYRAGDQGIQYWRYMNPHLPGWAHSGAIGPPVYDEAGAKNVYGMALAKEQLQQPLEMGSGGR